MLENKSVVQENRGARLLFVGDLMFDRGIRYYSLKNGENEFIFDHYFNEDVRNGLEVEVKINKATMQMEFEEKNFTYNLGAKQFWQNNSYCATIGRNKS